MKGIILAGGKATRLSPVTLTTSKQLLPIYNKQMIFYPLNTLVKAGVTEVLIIVSPEHAGQFLSLLGPMFDKSGINLNFKVQTYPRGLADAFILGEDFIGEDNVAMILGDNIFESDFLADFTSFTYGCKIFCKPVNCPEKYGVVVFDSLGNIVKIVEKPKEFIGNYAITGLYLFDSGVINIAKNLKPSERGELEITDLISHYLESNMLSYRTIDTAWFDAGTFDDWLDANIYVRKHRLYENQL